MCWIFKSNKIGIIDDFGIGNGFLKEGCGYYDFINGDGRGYGYYPKDDEYLIYFRDKCSGAGYGDIQGAGSQYGL